MRFCQCHSDQLTEALKARGLGHMIAKSPEESVERLANPSRDNFDPYVAAHNVLMRAATKAGGLDMALAEVCPMCVADSQEDCKGLATVWIEGAVANIDEYVKTSGLLKVA